METFVNTWKLDKITLAWWGKCPTVDSPKLLQYFQHHHTLHIIWNFLHAYWNHTWHVQPNHHKSQQRCILTPKRWKHLATRGKLNKITLVWWGKCPTVDSPKLQYFNTTTIFVHNTTWNINSFWHGFLNIQLNHHKSQWRIEDTCNSTKMETFGNTRKTW